MVFIAESVPFISHIVIRLNFKERLANLYKGNIAGKGTLPNSENLSADDIDAVAVYLMSGSCIVVNVRSGIAQKRKDSPGVINATNFLVIILKIFP